MVSFEWEVYRFPLRTASACCPGAQGHSIVEFAPPFVVPVATGTQGPMPISVPPRKPLTQDSGLDSGCGRKDGGISRQLNDPEKSRQGLFILRRGRMLSGRCLELLFV